tara:strand:- start:503 stop:961 length:459 start_codon:yes stop_codon:yes gene_type:complete
MIIKNIYDLITFISVNLEDPSTQGLDNLISDYQQIEPIEDPIFWLSIGAFICLITGLIFADIMKSKLNNWTTKKISPLPLENPRTISCWFAFFSGLTIIFVSALSVLNFALIKSMIFSFVISILFGISMWKAIKDLFVQVEAGTVKEIDDFF